MMTSLIDVDSLLAIDVGSVNTRAFLFDVANGAYRFLAAGVAPTTVQGAFNNISDGVHMALEHLQEITGRTLIGNDGHLIVPTHADGTGVDALMCTLSAGPAVQTAVVGLLADVSLESIQRLAASTYSHVVEAIGLTDRRGTEAKIDAIIRAKPDLILIAGGLEGGASRSIMKLLEVIGLACFLIPVEKRPEVIYAGNQALSEKVQTKLGKLTRVKLAPNIRPTVSVEDLSPALEVVNDAVLQIRMRQIDGVKQLSDMMGGNLTLSSTAFGRMVRFLSHIYTSNKGVLGIDLGATSTTIAAGFAGKLCLNVCQPLGMGDGLSGITQHVAEVNNWLPVMVQESYISEYFYNKQLHPGTVPATVDDLAIEQACARLVLRSALRQTSQRFHQISYSTSLGLTTPFEPILASGAILTQAPTPGQALLMLLDGLQPIGVTTLVLDQNNLLSALGAAAGINSLLPVQILESSAFLNLGTVVSPVSSARYGTLIMRVRMTTEDGSENRFDIKQGFLTVLPIPLGRKARLRLDYSHGTEIGFGNSGSSSLNVVGGVLGTIIDARGRPLGLPEDSSRRRELIKKWLWTLGG
jgi:MutL protein